MRFEEITTVRVYSLPGLQTPRLGTVALPVLRCTVYRSHAGSITLANLHFLRLGSFENRSVTFNPFVAELVKRVRASNPKTPILSGMPPLIWWSWVVTFAALGLVLLSSIVLGLIGLLSEHRLSLGTAAVLAVLAVMLAGPATFLRALWLRRSRPLDTNKI